MLSNILFVYNSDIAQSLIDAEAFIALRGYPVHLFGVNWSSKLVTTTFEFIERLQGANAPTLQADGFKWDGELVNTYDGMDVIPAINEIAVAYPQIDGVIFSTYTPVRYNPFAAGEVYALPAQIAVQFYIARHSSSQNVLPNGRLGAPESTNELTAIEQVTRLGGRVFDEAVAQALVSEQTYNINKPIWSYSTDTGAQYGWTEAYNTAFRDWLRARFPWAVDVPFDYPTAMTEVNDGPKYDMFAFCAPTGQMNDIGSRPYEDNYRVRPGGWCAHWYSAMWPFAQNFLHNGGAACVTSVWEPLSNGVRDPTEICKRLYEDGLSLMECMPTSVVPNSCPLQTALLNAHRVTVFGVPDYRPYAIKTRPRVSGGPFV